MLLIELCAEEGGVLVRFVHSGLPDGQGQGYARGWVDHYLVPMADWFGALRGLSDR